jgi:ABC-type protease/lipase transport system fused ATPase/permease subunit
MLTGPMFMMQVYNKVLTRKSLPTSLLVLVLYIFYGLLECLRGKLTARFSTAFDTRDVEARSRPESYSRRGPVRAL